MGTTYNEWGKSYPKICMPTCRKTQESKTVKSIQQSSLLSFLHQCHYIPLMFINKNMTTNNHRYQLQTTKSEIKTLVHLCKNVFRNKETTCLIPRASLKSSSRARIMYLWKLNFGTPLQWFYQTNGYNTQVLQIIPPHSST